MSTEQIQEYTSRILLTIGGGSYGMYEMFKTGSEFCKVLMPYLSVISFAVYFILNFKKLVGLVAKPFKKKKP